MKKIDVMNFQDNQMLARLYTIAANYQNKFPELPAEEELIKYGESIAAENFICPEGKRRGLVNNIVLFLLNAPSCFDAVTKL